jgi:hypothetical protein
MKRSDINPMPEYFGRYITQVEDVELLQAFENSLRKIDDLDIEKLGRIGKQVYADGKWTVNYILQHLIDWERILGYRTLVFARQAGVTPEGIDEQILADNFDADRRELADIIAELRLVRLSTKSMFESFNDEILLTKGRVWKDEMSVLAMGFNIIGHQVHHFKIIEERYFPLDK